MTTVAQMIAWMQTLPPDAEVECGKEIHSNYECYMSMAPVDISDCHVCDYTSDEDRAKYPHMAGKVIVFINAE
jgi:hypothetical protein